MLSQKYPHSTIIWNCFLNGINAVNVTRQLALVSSLRNEHVFLCTTTLLIQFGIATSKQMVLLEVVVLHKFFLGTCNPKKGGERTYPNQMFAVPSEDWDSWGHKITTVYISSLGRREISGIFFSTVSEICEHNL